MCMTRPRQGGFTLIEMIVFIVVISVGIAGILSVMTSVVKSSGDPMVQKQAVAIAESLLEEIVLKEYCDPDTVDMTTNPPTCGTPTVEASRQLYDDVSDYNGYATATGIQDIYGAAVASLSGYNISPAVAVTTPTLNGVTVRRIVVSVTGPQGVISLTGYRGNY